MKAPKAPARPGITLFEVIASLMLVSVVLLAALETVGGAARSTAAAAIDHAAQSLADELLAEVLAYPYEDPDGSPSLIGRESGEPSSPSNRLAMDDIDDFNSWSSSPPESRDGTPIAGYDGWVRRVQVIPVRVEPGGDGRLVNYGVETGVKRVSVFVDGPNDKHVEVNVLRFKGGAGESAPALAADWVIGVNVSLVLESGKRVQGGVGLVNDAEAP